MPKCATGRFCRSGCYESVTVRGLWVPGAASRARTSKEKKTTEEQQVENLTLLGLSARRSYPSTDRSHLQLHSDGGKRKRQGAAAAAWVLLAWSYSADELGWHRTVLARGGDYITEASCSSFCAEAIALERGLAFIAAAFHKSADC